MARFGRWGVVRHSEVRSVMAGEVRLGKSR
nr:MAG TPA: hypothetical protein [Caudoviricetes sp.]